MYVCSWGCSVNVQGISWCGCLHVPLAHSLCIASMTAIPVQCSGVEPSTYVRLCNHTVNHPMYCTCLIPPQEAAFTVGSHPGHIWLLWTIFCVQPFSCGTTRSSQHQCLLPLCHPPWRAGALTGQCTCGVDVCTYVHMCIRICIACRSVGAYQGIRVSYVVCITAVHMHSIYITVWGVQHHVHCTLGCVLSVKVLPVNISTVHSTLASNYCKSVIRYITLPHSLDLPYCVTNELLD